METFHTIVIGSGSGGLTVAVGLSKLGKKVALVEKHQVGGDCTNVGCIPSKTLIHGSFQESRSEPVLQLVRQRRDHLREEETDWIEAMKGVTLVRGYARFLSPKTVSVSDEGGGSRELKAKNIVISTGSRPRTVFLPGLPASRLLTNETIFELTAAPAHLAIVGGGVIGLEMAFAFRRLGTRVTLLDRGSRVLKVSEPEVSEVLQKRMADLGIEVRLQAELVSFEEETRSLLLASGDPVSEVDAVLVAAGRVPNLDLDLERAGVIWQENGVPTDTVGQTNVPGIYAIGDVNFRSAFTHSANHQGRRLVKRLALGFLPAPAPEPPYPSATFTEPEVAQVGPTLEQLKTHYRPEVLRTQVVQLKDTDRGYTMGLEDGFVMIHAMAVTGKVLSATVVAPSAGEMISVLTLSLTRGISLYQLADLVFPYPVLSDAIKKAANAFVFETLGGLPKELWSYLRYRFATP